MSLTPNQQTHFLSSPFPCQQIPSVLLPTYLPHGVQWVCPYGGPACLSMLNGLSGSSAIGVCCNANLISAQRSQGSFVQQSQIIIGPSPPCQNVWVSSNARGAQELISMSNWVPRNPGNTHPGLTQRLELRTSSTPTQENAWAFVTMPTVRVNSQTPLAQHSCSNTLHQDMSFAPAVDNYPRLTSPLVDRRGGGRRRQDSQMQ